MKIQHLINVSLRSILRNRMRSLLTSLGVIIGVSSVIIMVAIGAGSEAQIREAISAMGTNLLQIRPPRGRFSANRLSTEDVLAIRREAEYISAVSGIVRTPATLAGPVGYVMADIWGCQEDYLYIKNYNLADGDFFSEADNNRRAKVAVIGRTVAEEIFGTVSPIGATVRVGNTPFTVIGLLARKGKTGMGDDQDNVVLVPLETARSRLLRSPRLDAIEISAKSEAYMALAEAEVEAIMRISHRLGPNDEADFQLFNQEEVIDIASSTTKTLTKLLAAIAAVSLLVGGIGIMNIMLVSVSERTREIGIRLSVGARKRDILAQFLSEALLLSLLGGLLGIGLSFLAVWALDRVWQIYAIIQGGIVALAVTFSALVGIFFGYYPAQKAASLNPIDALRTE